MPRPPLPDYGQFEFVRLRVQEQQHMEAAIKNAWLHVAQTELEKAQSSWDPAIAQRYRDATTQAIIYAMGGN